METAGAVSREEDPETVRRLAKKRKAGKGKLGGDKGFDGNFGSVSEKKAYDLNVSVDAELDQKNGKKKRKKKRKKDAIELEELSDGGVIMGDENGGSVCESEDKTKLDKQKRKKEKKKAYKDTMEMEQPDNVDMGEGDDRVVCESEKCSVTLEEGKQVDMSKIEDKKRKGKKKRKESGNVPQDVGQNTLAAGDVKSGKKEREKSKDKNEAGEVRKEKVAQRKDKGKRVSFTVAVEVFGDGVDDKESDEGGVDEKSNEGGVDEESDKGSEFKLVHFKRFTQEEDAKLMEAMRNYVEMKQLGEKGLEMIWSSRKHPVLRGCWTEIAKALPHRPRIAIFGRARKLLYRSVARKWTKEEYGDGVDDKESDEGGVDEESDKGSEFKLVHGKRFTPEEDATLMEAMRNYVEMKQLGEGLEVLRPRRKHPGLRGCWREIAKALPHRPCNAVSNRARTLLSRSAARKWTKEEYEIVRRFVEKHGTDWATLADELGKCKVHVKDCWRRIKPKNLRKGFWTQDEYQNLFDLVNLDLRVKAHQKINHGHRIIRENISWEAISDKLTTRNNKDCCRKWYEQLASPLVKQGTWADTDDYLLVDALQKVDAVCLEDVDWDNLLDHRSGELCRQRWNQMVRSLVGHREKSFIEQVEVLSRRYPLEMVDYRNDG